jgi:dTDP-4-amino-4,6-dideoxygalactose transaminase
VRFYDVQPDLTAEPRRIAEALDRSDAGLVYLIHYFGVLQPFRREIANLCAERGVLLVEDCAHSLLTAGSGETGDIQLYSFRKIIPLPDGGGLRLRAPGAIVPTFHAAIYSTVLSTLSMLKSRINVRSELLSRSGLETGTSTLHRRSASPPSRVLPLSSRARRIMRDVPLTPIVETRRAGYDFWRERVERSRHARAVFGELGRGTCPLGFPVMIDERDAVRSRLREAGIHLQVHWPLPSPPSFVNSHRIARSICTLPVYPPTRPSDVQGLERLLLQL